ncbi:MAG: diaminopimelate decarboxylase [Paludibacteraceae bacterium]|nr:diaminopimelate decarboxylase [Paludibacteraceae bacterium]MEE3485194.1 diaminopimelate decarboxylase [Bacteroidales bacterium]
MIKGKFPIEKFKNIETPFYYYDVDLLNKTLELVGKCSKEHGFEVHYAVKANANKKVLGIISGAGLGADCVSGNEVQAAIEAGFPANKIVFAGVGKTDKEINLALDNDIFCFNAESIPELEVIDELAGKKGKIANVELRINPNVDAHTHQKITTGLNENKFGFNIEDLPFIVKMIQRSKNLKFVGLHFHIGSQITDLTVYESLCVRINEIQDDFDKWGVKVENINIGGGLGINYEHPNHIPIADFESYFRIFSKHLKLREGQRLHCEPGRSLVAQCGSLITKVTYVKKGVNKQFAIVDAGMTDLIRPALYDAYHRIENISSDNPVEKYDVVGPICESSDVFDKDVELNRTQRGDYLAIRSAGAYGEIMASGYNLRKLPLGYLSTEL